MKSFILGTVFGVSIGTVGFNGIAPIMDNGVKMIQYQTIKAVESNNQLTFGEVK
jgi:hypothetical protein